MLAHLLRKVAGTTLLLVGVYVGLVALHHEPCRQSKLLQLGLMVLAWGIGGPGLMLVNSKRKAPAARQDEGSDE